MLYKLSTATQLDCRMVWGVPAAPPPPRPTRLPKLLTGEGPVGEAWTWET